MSFTHIAFDIDGTLTNSEYAVLQSLQDTLLHFTGTTPPKEELTFVLGITGVDGLKRLGVEDIETTLAYWVEKLHDYGDTITVFPGIPGLLEQLKARGVVMGVISSQNREEYAHGIAPTPLDRYFSTRVLVEDTIQHKPSSEPMLKFLELTGAKADSVLYVGDREGDMKCAHGAGVKFALARWGNPDGEMDADYFLQSPADLLELL